MACAMSVLGLLPGVLKWEALHFLETKIKLYFQYHYRKILLHKLMACIQFRNVIRYKEVLDLIR